MTNENENNRNNINEQPEDENVNISDFYPEDEEKLVSGKLDEDTLVFAMNERARKKELKKKNGRLTKGQITLICIISAVYMILLLMFVRLVTYKPADNGEVPFDTTEDEEIDNPTGGEKSDSGKNTYSEVGESYNILVVGHDKMAHLADVTMIVNCNTKSKTVSVMQIPRDTYVSYNYITGKINAMYASYYNAAWNNKSADPYVDSLEEYASMLEKNLCIKIHYSVIVNLDGFKNIVDALDGVDVYVPNAMYYTDPEQGLYIDIPAGMQHLDGSMAEGFVRFRSGYVQADLGRVNAQKIFMTALFSKVKSTVKSVDVATLNDLAGEIKNNVSTDMTPSDILYFAKLALKIDLEDISMLTLPGTVSGSYYVMNRAATLDAINNYFNVYSKDISDKIFDKNRAFCDTGNDYMSAVYYDDPANVLDGVYTGDSINDDSIYIPRTQTWTPSNNTWYPDYIEDTDNTADDYVPETDEIIEADETDEELYELPPEETENDLTEEKTIKDEETVEYEEDIFDVQEDEEQTEEITDDTSEYSEEYNG